MCIWWERGGEPGPRVLHSSWSYLLSDFLSSTLLCTPPPNIRFKLKCKKCNLKFLSKVPPASLGRASIGREPLDPCRGLLLQLFLFLNSAKLHVPIPPKLEARSGKLATAKLAHGVMFPTSLKMNWRRDTEMSPLEEKRKGSDGEPGSRWHKGVTGSYEDRGGGALHSLSCSLSALHQCISFSVLTPCKAIS